MLPGNAERVCPVGLDKDECMKIERTKNAVRNIVFDGSLKLLNMVIPFILRSVMLHYLGVQYLGLNGLFRSIPYCPF